MTDWSHLKKGTIMFATETSRGKLCSQSDLEIFQSKERKDEMFNVFLFICLFVSGFITARFDFLGWLHIEVFEAQLWGHKVEATF